jgi:hypothetical protein
MGKVIALKRKETTPRNNFDTHFGVCPACGSHDGFVNIGKNHFFVCHQHKHAWNVGWNLFSCWQEETEEDWKKNEALLNGYRFVEPRYIQT